MGIPAAVEKAVRLATGNKCEVCGLHERHGVAGFSRDLLEMHHLQPEAKGGPSIPENFLLVCPTDHTLAQEVADGGAWDKARQVAFCRKVRKAKVR